MKKIIRTINANFEETIMAVLLVVMTVVMFVQIVSRYVFKDAISWGEEFCRYALVYSAFLAFPLCIKRGKTLKIDIVVDLFPKKMRYVLELLGDVVTIFFYAYLTYHSIFLVIRYYTSGVVSSIVQMPLWFLYIVVPIGFCIAFLRQIWSTYLLIAGKENEFAVRGEIIE